MKPSDFFKVIESFAPLKLSRELCEKDNGYDNSGIILPTEKDVKRVLFSLDLTVNAVEKAIERGAELIVTHHPAIYNPIKTVDGALLKAASNGIGVFSMHLNFDCAVHGVDHYLALGLGADSYSILTPLSEGGYGRFFKTDRSFSDIYHSAVKEFCTENVMCFGNLNSKIKSVASFCGAGLDEKNAETQADLLVSSDVKHHIVLSCLERGACVMVISHYASENYGFKRAMEELSRNPQLNNLEFYYFDDERFN